jgi:hypothetical protein
VSTSEKKPREWTPTQAFIPRESRDLTTGDTQFQTRDGNLYERSKETGVIRSMHSKIRRKKDRVKARREKR